jgi:hypothetical protein
MTRYISDICTREDVTEQLEKADPGSGVPAPVTAEYADFVAYVDRAIHAASQYISRVTERVFVPYKDTRNYYFNEICLNGAYNTRGGMTTLKLGEDLLVTSSLTWDGTLLSASYYRERPSNALPYQSILFDRDNLPSMGTDFDDCIAIVGTWGCHDNTSQMYTQVDSSVTLATTTATSLTVTDAALYRVWQYIKIEDELLQITARNESTEVLTVKRGVNGTTAAAHTAQACSVFNPVEDIRIAATRLAAWAYNNRADLGTQLSLPDGGSIKNEIPAFVNETLTRLRRYYVGSG